jgi:hypothetical protein
MTCVVALVLKDKVYMGADSAGVEGYNLTIRKDPKIFQVGDFLIGFTSSFRMGQLLGYSLVVPDRNPNMSVDQYMNTVFIDAVRNCLAEGGMSTKDNGVESGGNFLVGYEGRLFEIGEDYQVGEGIHPFNAVGCGTNIALGSLYSTASSKMSPATRLTTALEAAEQFSSGVRAPFIFASL